MSALTGIPRWRIVCVEITQVTFNGGSTKLWRAV